MISQCYPVTFADFLYIYIFFFSKNVLAFQLYFDKTFLYSNLTLGKDKPIPAYLFGEGDG